MQYDKPVSPLCIPITIDFNGGTEGDTLYTYTAEKDFVIKDMSLIVTEAIVTGGHKISVEIETVEKAVFTSVVSDPIGTMYTPDTAINTSKPIAVSKGDEIEIVLKTKVDTAGAGMLYLWIQEES